MPTRMQTFSKRENNLLVLLGLMTRYTRFEGTVPDYTEKFSIFISINSNSIPTADLKKTAYKTRAANFRRAMRVYSPPPSLAP